MTQQERDKLIEDIDSNIIQPSEVMTLEEMKRYMAGYEDARDAIMDCIDRAYRNSNYEKENS